MAGLVDNLFGPLDIEYCLYFYFLSIFGFVLLVLFLVPAILYGLKNRKGVEYYIQIIGVSLGYLIFYFQNRLLHSMCISK
jgi:hypothetical protein